MPLGTITRKSYGAALEEQNLVLEPFVAYQRLTGLPANWKRCRIAAILGFCGLSSPEQAPVSERLVPFTNRGLPLIGLTNGAGLPTESGVDFIGMSLVGGHPASASLDLVASGTPTSVRLSRYGYPSACAYPSGMFSRGATISIGQDATDCGPTHQPTESTGFAFGLMCDLNLSTDAVLKTKITSVSNVTDTLLGLNSMLTLTAPSFADVSGGWWTSAVPSGCNHLFLRFPFGSNRLKIHALRVMQLA